MSDEIARREEGVLEKTPSADIGGERWWPIQTIGPMMGYHDGAGLRKLIAKNREDFNDGTDVLHLEGADAVRAVDQFCKVPGDFSNRIAKVRRLLLLSRSGIEMAAVLSRTDGARNFRRKLLAERRTQAPASSLSEAAIRRLVDERIRHHIVDLERTIVGVLATVETRTETRRLEIQPPRTPERRQRMEIDPEAMLDSWDRLFGSSRVSASDAYAISHRVSPTEPLRSLANESKSVTAFGQRLSALVRKEGRRLERGTTGAQRFYRLLSVDSED